MGWGVRVSMGGVGCGCGGEGEYGCVSGVGKPARV